MPLSLPEFLCQMAASPALTLTVLLTLAVLLVNGWTDAPNAIAAAVVTGALPFRPAVGLAALCNLLGVLCVTAVNTSVAETIYSIASFGGGPRRALAALCAAMASIVLWAAAAWWFGHPHQREPRTGSRHLRGGRRPGGQLVLHPVGLLGPGGAGAAGLSGSGLLGGRRALRALSRLSWSDRLFRRAQIPGAALTAFLHGAQDGQKFLGILLLGIALSQGRQDEQTFLIPFWLMALCAGSMALGTGMGGRRIIDTVGREMVRLGPREGLASDLGGGGCLLLATLLGLPVSTTHTRTAALLGAGSTSGRRIDWSVARSIALTWVLTFPGCFTLGWCMARLFLAWV